MHELWYDASDGWQHNDLTQLVPGAADHPPAPGSPLFGYATPWNQQEHVNYLDGAGHVHELWYSHSSGSWTHNDLTQLAPGATGYTAAPGSPLDGYTT